MSEKVLRRIVEAHASASVGPSPEQRQPTLVVTLTGAPSVERFNELSAADRVRAAGKLLESEGVRDLDWRAPARAMDAATAALPPGTSAAVRRLMRDYNARPISTTMSATDSAFVAPPAAHPEVRAIRRRIADFRKSVDVDRQRARSGAPARAHRDLDGILAARAERVVGRDESPEEFWDRVPANDAMADCAITHCAAVGRATDADNSRWLEKFAKYGTAVEGVRA